MARYEATAELILSWSVAPLADPPPDDPEEDPEDCEDPEDEEDEPDEDDEPPPVLFPSLKSVSMFGLPSVPIYPLSTSAMSASGL